jgi:hypothetical protein
MLDALGVLSQSRKLERLPMGLSKAASKVWLANIETDGKLTFAALQGSSRSSFEFGALTAEDHALLSRLAARLNPTSKEAMLVAGVYLELSGQTDVADDYYRQAGSELKAISDGMFE